MDSSAATRWEVVPLEALRVGPGEVLILRLPEDVRAEALEGLRETLKFVGVSERVLILSAEVEATVVEADRANA